MLACQLAEHSWHRFGLEAENATMPSHGMLMITAWGRTHRMFLFSSFALFLVSFQSPDMLNASLLNCIVAITQFVKHFPLPHFHRLS